MRRTVTVQMKSRIFLAAVLCLCMVPGLLRAQTDLSVQMEAPWLRGVDALVESAVGHQQAEESLTDLLVRQPDFALAQLAYADLMYVRMGVLSEPGQAAGTASLVAPQAALRDLQLEASKRAQYAQLRGRLGSHDKSNDEHVLAAPAGVIQLAENFPRLVVVDGAHSRVEIYSHQGGQFTLEQDFYTSVAKRGMHKKIEGDKRTPVGVYFTTQRLGQKNLGALYGAGAIALNYPNAWDRISGRNGHGIWLHGVPFDRYNRAPLATNGCVALPNADYLALDATLGLNVTPVVVVEQRGRMSQAGRAERAAFFSNKLENWQMVQNAGHTAALDSFYSDRLPVKGRVGAKAVTSARKAVRHLSIFQYPTEFENQEMVLLVFEQYTLDAPQTSRWLRQYWANQTGNWEIVAEENDALLPVHHRGIPSGVVRSQHTIDGSG